MLIVMRVPREPHAIELALGAFGRVGTRGEVVQGKAALADVAAPVTGKYDSVYLVLLNALLAINIWTLSRLPVRVPLYESGVRYRREPPGAEVWQSAPALLLNGEGDCEDLTAAWVAEQYVFQGIPPDSPKGPKVRLTYARRQDGSRLYHVTAKNPDGTIEDPSRVLGMGQDEEG